MVNRLINVNELRTLLLLYISPLKFLIET